MNKFLIISSIVIIFSTFGCASIAHGPVQTVDITSQPKGAKISINGKDFGVTPKTIVLPRKGRLRGEHSQKKWYDVKIELAGFYPYELKIKREMDEWFLGNIVLGGLIGIIIDAANGSMYKLNPDQIIAQLARQGDYNENVGEIYPYADNEESTIIYPTGKLVLYRTAKKEAELPFNFFITDDVKESFVPYSFAELDIDITGEPVIIYYGNENKKQYIVDLKANETKYLEFSISKKDNVLKITEVEPRDGKFYSEQAKFYQDKRQRKEHKQ